MRLLATCAVLLLVSCQKSKEPEARPVDKAPQHAEPALPSGHPLIGHPPDMPTPIAPAAAPAQAGDAAARTGLAWEDPPALTRRTPKSSMRVAEYGATGKPQVELAVFYFGPDQGGSVEANMTRWVGQFTQSDGSPTKPERRERSVKGIDVALVEAQGTYSGGMAMPGMAASPAIPTAMLLGAIAKGPKGSVFFKLVGPKADVESVRGAFDALIGSLKPAP